MMVLVLVKRLYSFWWQRSATTHVFFARNHPCAQIAIKIILFFYCIVSRVLGWQFFYNNSNMSIVTNINCITVDIFFPDWCWHWWCEIIKILNNEKRLDQITAAAAIVIKIRMTILITAKIINWRILLCLWRWQ